ncbi:MAG UNVERIFIED_CONTAM: NAD-binding protein [Rickettsiaceae bacterium]|jgi:thioredoxin reductase
MPVIVLGGGLTAIDSATEAANYYKGTDNKDVTIIYRKSMREAPSYKENHIELQTAIDMGIKFVENTSLESDRIGRSWRY